MAPLASGSSVAHAADSDLSLYWWDGDKTQKIDTPEPYTNASQYGSNDKANGLCVKGASGQTYVPRRNTPRHLPAGRSESVQSENLPHPTRQRHSQSGTLGPRQRHTQRAHRTPILLVQRNDATQQPREPTVHRRRRPTMDRRQQCGPHHRTGFNPTGIHSNCDGPQLDASGHLNLSSIRISLGNRPPGSSSRSTSNCNQHNHYRADPTIRGPGSVYPPNDDDACSDRLHRYGSCSGLYKEKIQQPNLTWTISHGSPKGFGLPA